MRLRWTLACLTLLFSQFQSFSQVTVNFSASNTSGCGTVNAQFTDQSSSTNGAIVSWSWDFDGASSSVQNPGNFFTTPGSYTICLTATDVSGAQNTLCKDDYIFVNGLPSPDFSVDPAAGCEPLTVVFHDESTAFGDIVEWTWGLGGTTGVTINSDGADVSSTYALPGSYSINLTVEDEFGCSNTITKSNAVMVESPPSIAFSAANTFSCNPPLQTNFTNENIEPGVTYTWDFGNGITYSGTTPPSVSYSQTGTYTVSLTAETSGGCTSTEVMTDYILIGSPATFTYNPQDGCEDLSVSFQDTSPFPADSVFWDFGDGMTSTAANPTHVYQDQGCFNVSFLRYSNGGCISTISSVNCIDVFAQPQLTIAVDQPIACEIPHTVQFNANQAGITDWLWDFGDGSTSTDPSPAHTYTSVGTYPVSLVVTNSFGCSNTITTDNIVIFEYTSEVTADNAFGCTPLTVELASTNNSLVPIVDWNWTLINDEAAPAVEVFGTGESTSLVLVDTGRYDIQLITINELGCQDTVVYQNDVGVGMPPIVDFSVSLDTACVNDDISFFDGSSSFANEWEWAFGDGGVSAAQDPDYEYAGIGPWDVTLTAIHHGCPNELTKEDFVFINIPLAGFNVVTNCVDHYTVDIDDASTGATSMVYDFGVAGIDTDTSSVPNAQYSYTDPGTYIITQMVSNDTTGCADTLRREVTIGIPDAQFALSPTTGCIPLTVQVSDNSNFAAQYSYELIDGQGTISNPESASPSILFSNPGLYAGLKLSITDINGCQDSITLMDSIYANAVTADFSVDPIAGCRPLPISMTDASSSVFGTVDQWSWTIPGALTGTLTDQNPDYTIPQNGTYDISLTVTDDWGCTNTFQIDDAVYVTSPAVEFTADTLGCTQSTVDFINMTQGDGLSYTWDFGDGTTSTEQNPAHFYAQEGVYTVCLDVIDINGCTNNTCKTDYVVISNPVALFIPDETYGACPPLLVNFENFSQNATVFNWDFGDASGNSDQINPSHIYTDPGTFSVSLIASSTFKCLDTLTLEDVIVLEGPVGNFHFDKDTTCIPESITFMAESLEPYDYLWDFGNGQIDSTLNVMTDTMTYSYNQAGRYIPKLILRDQAGCNVTIESPDTITVGLLEIDFVAIDTALCEGETGTTFINLTNSSSPIASLEWNFEGGDPATSTFDNVNVNYNNEGAYDVQLIADNGICKDSVTRNDYIGVGANPVVDFSFTPASGCVPLTVQFTDLSTVVNSTINQWYWDFVGVGSAEVQNPVHIFNEANSSLQEVELTVYSAMGCSNSMEVSFPTLPVPAATIEQLPTLCKGEPAILVPVISTDTTGMSFQWSGEPSLSCTDCLMPMIAPQDTTVYELVLTNIFGCTSTFTTTVNVLPDSIPAITISPDTSICYNSLIQLQGGGGDHLNAYQWDTSTEGLSCYEACFNPVASPEETSTYYLTVTNLNGCSAIDSVTVEVVDPDQPIAGLDRVICNGDSVQLSIAYGEDPSWINPTALTCAYCPDPIAFPSEDITYVVEAFTDIGCKIIDTVVVEVMTDADFTAGEDDVICAGESLNLIGESEGGNPTWSPVNSLSSATEWNPIANPTTTTEYILTVERDLCTMTDTVAIEVIDQTTIWGRDTTICEGDEVLLEVFGETDYYEWEDSEFLSDLSSQSVYAFPERTTTFVVSGKLGTCAEDTASFTVTINELPDIYTAPNRYYLPGDFVDLLVRPTEDNTNPLSYEWTPAVGLSCRTCTTPTVSPEADIVYTVTATDSIYGCTSERSVNITQLYACPDELFNVPNVFSPNADGVNDVLELKLSPTVEEIKNFSIYNRWGALMYQTDDRFDGWDGTYRGKVMEDGVYIYVLEVVCPIDGSVIMKRGDITIVK